MITHTSTWPEDLELTGKRVGVLRDRVVGRPGGCAKRPGRRPRSRCFSRRPTGSCPRAAGTSATRERRWNRNRAGLRLAPGQALRPVRPARSTGPATPGPAAGLTSAAAGRRWSTSTTALRRHAGAAELVTPPFAFEGKRTVLSDTYYEALTRPNVTLVPHAVTALTRVRGGRRRRSRTRARRDRAGHRL